MTTWGIFDFFAPRGFSLPRAMDTKPEPSAPDAALTRSRWALACRGDEKAFRELAESYWYCVYAWWRRAGLDSVKAPTATLASFSRWLSDPAPLAAEISNRLREWIPSRLTELSVSGVKLKGEPPLAIDSAWAETRYADEPDGDAEVIFQRRWALTILEFTTNALKGEYSARGEDKLFEELLAFAGFEPSDDERYATAASRTGRTSGAMRKAVFDFRTRHRELLRGFVADTVKYPTDIESEITALLLACDAIGAQAATAPLPTVLQSVQPDQVLARAMNSVKMSTAGSGGWTPPTVQEAARLFQNYEVVALLGRGGMGAVYQARQTALDRLVAIKLLPLEVSVDRDFADRFRREARAMAKLNHPNIISVFDFGQTSEGHLYFVMEFVDGAMLHTLIHGPEPIQPAEALILLEQVCDALAYAHGKGIVHRDIKPANVMVEREGRVKVADFGLARLTDGASAEQWGTTMTGIVMGTPDYMSPEQKRGSHVDHRSDIYALGVMLYEMICKETPQGAFILPSKHCGIDKRLDGIVTKALATKPEERFQSTAEMRTAIEIVRPAVAKAQAKKAPPNPPAPVKPKPSPLPSAPPFTKDGRLSFAKIAIVAILLIAAGAFAFVKWRRVEVNLGAAVVVDAMSARASSATPAGTLPAGEPASSAGAPKPASRALALPRPLLAATKDAPFVNSLGMKFVPVPIQSGPTAGQRVLFSVWDTRVQDYAAYASVKKVDDTWTRQNKDGVPVGRELDHPVVGVSWEDAQAFCRWLTEKEVAEGKLPKGKKYRLPTDEEWSWAVGLPPELGATPAEKNGKNSVDFPWGKEWPPKGKVGNYADDAFHAKFPPNEDEKDDGKKNRWIESYSDGFATTSPVGSFPANAYGLYDMGGNVWQWCEDWFDASHNEGVLRGASWALNYRRTLLSSFRSRTPTSLRSGDNGFRCVVDDVSARAGSGAPAGTLPAGEPASSAGAPKPASGALALPGPPSEATRDAPFVNTLGMNFVPVPIQSGPTAGQRVLFSVWDTRVQDYTTFVKETKHEWPKSDYSQDPTHPAINVSWEDAQLFCQWLSMRDHAANRLPADLRYRLPSDHEWSCAVGIGEREDAAKLPSEKNGKITDAFPWGKQWPPPTGAGNYAGEELRPALSDGKYSYIKGVITNYNDGFVYTSPVGSFAANAHGLFDMGGNAWQWCEDWFDKEQKLRVFRGGSWASQDRSDIQSSNRGHNAPTTRNRDYGFRCVLSAEAR